MTKQLSFPNGTLPATASSDTSCVILCYVKYVFQSISGIAVKGINVEDTIRSDNGKFYSDVLGECVLLQTKRLIKKEVDALKYVEAEQRIQKENEDFVATYHKKLLSLISEIHQNNIYEIDVTFGMSGVRFVVEWSSITLPYDVALEDVDWEIKFNMEQAGELIPSVLQNRAEEKAKQEKIEEAKAKLTPEEIELLGLTK